MKRADTWRWFAGRQRRRNRRTAMYIYIVVLFAELWLGVAVIVVRARSHESWWLALLMIVAALIGFAGLVAPWFCERMADKAELQD